MIKNVIFDIGKVLVDFAWKETMEDLGFDDECIDVLGRELVNDKIWDEFDLGIIPENENLEAAVKKIPRYEKEIRLFWENLIMTIRPYDYCEKWIRDLKSEGLNVYLLTNYPDSLFDKSVECGFPFYPYIDGEVVSSRVKMRKPDEGIYKCILEKYSLNPDECVFFDDRIVNVETALRLGFHAFVFKNYEQACNDLRNQMKE